MSTDFLQNKCFLVLEDGTVLPGQPFGATKPIDGEVENMEPPVSGLARIEIKDESDPLQLFKEWLQEIRKYVRRPNIMNLATSSKDGQVTNRTVVLRDILEDGSFALLTQSSSIKVRHFKENPRVALCFTWLYMKDTTSVSRQVRIEGIAEELPRELTEYYFQIDAPYAKIRNIVCTSGNKVENWDELKESHDKMLEKLRNGEELKIPDKSVGYKIVPTSFEFYFDYDTYIADRILFKKTEDFWACERIET